MKRLMMAGVLALAMIAASQQTASAWCCFSMGGSFHINYQGGGCCFTCNYNSTAPPCCGPGYGGFGYGGYGGFAGYPPVFGGYGYASAPTAPHAAPQAAPAAPTQTTTAQQVGYYPQAGSGYGYGDGYGYGYGQAPGYWYGN